MNEQIDIELKSDVLNEVLTTPPSWLVKSGSTLFLFVIMLLIGLSFLITYPNELTGDVSIYSNHPPVEFQNQLYGKLVDLQVKDQQYVKKGKVLAQFNNEIDPHQIQMVQSFLFKISVMESFEKIPIKKELDEIQLGTLQENWTNLLALVKERNSLISSNIFNKKLTSLRNEITQRKQLQVIANKKLRLIEREINLQEVQTLSAQRLLDKKAISKDEYLREEKAENQLQQQYQNQSEAIVQNEIQLNNLVKNLNETAYNDQQQLQQLQASIQMNTNILQNSINEWEKNTAWIAPFDGKILFNKQLNVSNFYKPDEASLVIVPKGNYFRGLMKVPSNGAGEIKKGQRVFIEFSDYLRNDYGLLEGKVKSITSISKNEEYEVEILLPDKLITTYKKEIPLKALLKGNAKIVTENKRLIERFFEKVLNAIEK